MPSNWSSGWYGTSELRLGLRPSCQVAQRSEVAGIAARVRDCERRPADWSVSGSDDLVDHIDLQLGRVGLLGVLVAARMQAYSDVGNAVKRVFGIATRIAAGRGFPQVVQPLSPDEE